MRYWLESFRVSQLVLNRLESAFDGLDLEAVIIPHFISGPLDAAQRIDFLRFHIARHRSQVEKTIGTLGFPST
jgi:hypothetical protein